MDHVLVDLALLLAKFSLLTLGDTSMVLSEMQREVVARGWLTDGQFLQAFAFSRITPGPGSVIAVPIGYHAAGIAGAITALIASYGPTALLAFAVVDVWGRLRERPWLKAVRTALTPVTAGLIFGTTYSLGSKAAVDVPSLALVASATLLLLRTKIPTAVIILGSGAVGALILYR